MAAQRLVYDGRVSDITSPLHPLLLPFHREANYKEGEGRTRDGETPNKAERGSSVSFWPCIQLFSQDPASWPLVSSA